MPVLGTKLHVPAMRRRLVSRSRLTDRLRVEPSSMPRLILVSAPAGFGKTTLIAQWLDRTKPDAMRRAGMLLADVEAEREEALAGSGEADS